MLAEEDDEKMVEFAIGGVCNCCLDKLNKAHLIDNEGVEMAAKCLTRLEAWPHPCTQHADNAGPGGPYSDQL